ncbi:hypothetical protein PVAND_000609 [Polypedilum vanderplanki]|uniref:LMBR1 domain-containing protein 2-like protein n=1 Tax=Polypedilum vanderplanki TaxID=319348 RepID=A0A9J6BL38_POLVA|nr:hypothetical protein PVAND_000609 [Polypedilum vanderplanki]
MYLLAFAICFAFILSIGFLYRYGNIPRQHPMVSVSVVIAWSFSFLIVFTIPLDITATVYRQCIATNNSTAENSNITNTSNCQQPWGMVSDDVFPNLWRIIYWSSQFLTWIILPLMQSYLKAGDFNFRGKLRSALIDNAIYYGTYLFICGVLLIYIALKPGVYLDWPKLKAIASSASNTWGLFLLVLLLGYALVEVPRSLFNNSKAGFTLQHAYFKLSKLSSDKAEAEENCEDVLESLQSLSLIVPLNHELRPCVEEILRKVPSELMEKAKRSVRSGESGANSVPSEKALIRLHRQVIKSLQVLQRTEALWNVQVEKILYLEDVEMNFLSSPPFRHELSSKRNCHPTFQWYWECVIKSPFLKVLAATTAIMSIMVVWSELTFFSSSPVLSIFARILNIARQSYDFVTIEIFSMATLCYLCYCAYSTIFRIKFLNLYYLAPHHQTNEHSLIFSGMLLCRLTPPMCLNFLGLMHMDSHIIRQRIQETYYTQIMGHMDVLGIIANGFNIYFPMLMVAICAATWFSLGSRILNALGFQQFMANDEISSELVNEGRDLIMREKRKKQRNQNATTRRDFQLRENVGGRGLLKDSSTSNVGYNTNGNMEDLSPEYGRTLTQEINARFGISTDVNFRPDFDDNTSRPRNIFDDV